MKHFTYSGSIFIPRRLEQHELPYIEEAVRAMRSHMNRAMLYRRMSLCLWFFFLALTMSSAYSGRYWLAVPQAFGLFVLLWPMKKANQATTLAEKELEAFESKFLPLDVEAKVVKHG